MIIIPLHVGAFIKFSNKIEIFFSYFLERINSLKVKLQEAQMKILRSMASK